MKEYHFSMKRDYRSRIDYSIGRIGIAHDTSLGVQNLSRIMHFIGFSLPYSVNGMPKVYILDRHTLYAHIVRYTLVNTN